MFTSDSVGVTVPALWKRLEAQDRLYVVVFADDSVPFMEHPDNIRQESYCQDDQAEALVYVFVEEEDAKEYMAEVIEADTDIRPSMLNVGSFSKDDLFRMTEALNEVAIENVGHPVRIELTLRVANNIIHDVIYSKYRPVN